MAGRDLSSELFGPEGGGGRDFSADLFGPSEAARKSTIGSEIVRGGKQLASSVRTGFGALTGSPEEAAIAGVARGQAIGEEAGEGASLEAVKKVYQERGLLSAAGEVASQIPRALAGQVPQLAAMAGGAKLGAMAGTAVAPGVGTVVGGVLGAGSTLLPQFFGSNVERQASEQMAKDQPVQIDRGAAGAAAAGQAAIESAGTAFVLGKRIVKGVLGIADDAALTTAKAQQAMTQAAERSLAAAAGRGVAKGVATEIPVEIASSVLERAQAGLDVTSPEAMAEYGEVAYQAGLVGGAIGAGAGPVDTAMARQGVKARTAFEEAEAKRVADAEAAEKAKIPPLALGSEGVFTPVALPDGSVAMTREELAQYEESQFQKKYAPQEGEKPYAPAPSLTGTDLASRLAQRPGEGGMEDLIASRRVAEEDARVEEMRRARVFPEGELDKQNILRTDRDAGLMSGMSERRAEREAAEKKEEQRLARVASQEEKARIARLGGIESPLVAAGRERFAEAARLEEEAAAKRAADEKKAAEAEAKAARLPAPAGLSQAMAGVPVGGELAGMISGRREAEAVKAEVPLDDDYAFLQREKQRLSQQDQTPDTKKLIGRIDERIGEVLKRDIERQRADAEAAKTSVFAQEQLPEVESRDVVVGNLELGQLRAAERLPDEPLTGREVKSIEKMRTAPPPVPDAQARLEQAEMDRRKFMRSKDAKQGNLMKYLEGKLALDEVSDIAPKGKGFEKLANEKGTYISEIVSDGMLDEFLPPDQRAGQANFDAQQAAETIKENLRNKVLQPFDTQTQIRQLDDSIAAAEREAKEPSTVQFDLSEVEPGEAATVERAATDQEIGDATDIRYKRATGKVGIGKQAVQDAVDTVKARWANAPEVVVAENMDDLTIPQEVRDHNKEAVAKGAKGSPQGFYYKGKAYVIADSIGSTNEAVEALMHEALGHFGLRGVFGPKMETVLRDVIKNRRTEVESKAEQYGLDPKNDKDMLEAAEEVLAVMAQTKPGLPFVKRALAVIRNFLRDLGFNIKMSDADIIQKYILPARAFVEGGKGRPTEGKPAAMREPAKAPPTDSSAFKKWFGDSKVVDENGDPMVVYHGTFVRPMGDGTDMGDIKAFDRMFTTRFRRPSIDTVGSWFSTNPGEGGAEMYSGKDQGSAIYPVYLSIKNPQITTFQLMTSRARKLHNGKDDGRSIGAEEVEAYRAWLKSMGKDGIKIEASGNEGSTEFDNQVAWIALEPTQIKSATGNIGTYDPDNADIRYSRQNIKGQPVLAQWTTPNDTKLYGETGKDDIIYSLQNKMIDTKRVVDAISATAGKIMAKWNPYLQEELFHGRTAKQTGDFLKKELRPLMQDMSERGVSIKDFEEYLHNRHAEDYNKHVAKINPKMPDGGSGIETADARAYLAGLTPQQKADFEALAKKIDAINKGTREVLVEGGLETRDLINEWEGAFPSYVPLKREELDYAYTAGGIGTGQGFDVRGNFSRRATGSERGVIDILANSAMQRERAIIKAEKNRVAQAMFGLAVQSPNPDFWLPIDPMAEVDPSAAQDLLSFGLSQQDLDFLMKEPRQKAVDKNSGQVVERINATLRNNENVMSMRFNGRDRYVFFNPNNPRSARMISSLKNLDADQLGYILGNVSKITRWFASVNTQYNPIFGAYNFLRDVQGAALQLSDTPLAKDRKAVVAGTLPALKGIYSALRAERDGQVVNTPWATLWNEFQEEGGQTGFRDQFSRSQERAEALEKELKMVTEGKLKSAGRGMINWLSDYNDSMENAVRLSAYKAALDRGIGKQEAASIAKNLTVNFNRKGQIAAQAGALYAFFNAAVQGTTRLAQTLRGPAGKKIMAGGFLLGTMQAALLAAAGFDDEEPPEFVRERNLILPIGGDKYLTFPMPLGYHVIPSTSRIITEWALSGFKDTPDRIASLTGMYLEAFNPVGNAGWSAQTLAPTFADPIVALTENRDWTGKPIARKDFSNLDPTPGYTRAKDTASEFSTQIAKFLNYASGGTEFKPGVLSPTPDQLDYLIGQVTGGIGREVLKAEQTALKTATGEELPPYKIPVVGRFYGETKSSAAESGRFYKNLTKLNEHENEIKGRRENREPIAEYMQENPEARLAPLARKTYSDIQKLRKRKEQLLDRDAPRESIKQVEDMITKRMQVFNARVEALRK
jgi:hypothetical protein